MSKLDIIIAPDPILRTTAEPISEVNSSIQALMEDMLKAMYDAQGIGLAANQVGLAKRVMVMDVADEADEKESPNPLMMANPELIWTSEEDSSYEEGCLSLPGQIAEVVRPAEVKLKYLDQNNTLQEIQAGGLLATCIQHELDHLNGILFVDHISRLKRDMIMRKVKKIKATRESEKGNFKSL